MKTAEEGGERGSAGARGGVARCAGSVEMDCHVVPLRRDSSR